MDGGDYKPDDAHAVNVFSEAARVPNILRSSHACLILMPPKKKNMYSCVLVVYTNFVHTTNTSIQLRTSTAVVCIHTYMYNVTYYSSMHTSTCMYVCMYYAYVCMYMYVWRSLDIMIMEK